MKKFVSAIFVIALSLNSVAQAAPLPGMPALIDANDIYAADRTNALSAVVKNFPEIAYVPNHTSNTLTEIDVKTKKIIATYKMKPGPQHVVPSWDLKVLYANSDKGNTLTPFDAKTGKPGKKIPLMDPYNLYFTPNGKYAVVMEERMKEIVFVDPHTFKVKKILKTRCADRKSTRLNSSHIPLSRMPSSA